MTSPANISQTIRVHRTSESIWKRGDHWVWLTGGTLVLCLFMIMIVVGIILVNGATFFWPKDVRLYEMKDGKKYLAIMRQKEVIPPAQARDQKLQADPNRRMVMVGNRDMYSQDFVWLNDQEILSSSRPPDVWVMDRREYGRFIGYLHFLQTKDRKLEGAEAAAVLPKAMERARELFDRIYRIEKSDIGAVNLQMERARLRQRKVERLGQGEKMASEIRSIEQATASLKEKYDAYVKEIAQLRSEMGQDRIGLEDVNGTVKELPMASIMEAWQPNQMGFFAKTGSYFTRLADFLMDDPRESNTEGGVFPAIFGTTLMVILMSIAVVPFGVLTAFYLCEYARQGPIVRAVRIALNNLAGVPSIVYGVFGLGFFVYFIGGNIDRFFYADALPTPTWGTGGILWASLTLALLTVPVVVMATEESIMAVPRGMREGSLALGASRFQTLKNILLPASLPGILTGVILAMARGAGEVAPLMITGVVKLAPSLPVDGLTPYLHLERKFMHLGFHIYDVGFQSPNIEASRPMVFTTALLLILLVIALNLGAILLRDYVRRRYTTGAFH